MESRQTPHLYECRVTLTGTAGRVYVAARTFGIRHTEFVEHGPFKLNGERLLLRGTHRHEDHAGYAAAMPDDLLDQEMQLIKDMGANFIRLAHYQQSRRVLELCDRLGLLVWEEIPWCRGGIGDDTFKEMGRRTLRNMIAQHYNHPSVLLWGLGNEDDWPTEYPEINQQDIRAYLQELNDLCTPARSIAHRPPSAAATSRATFPTSTRPRSGPAGIAEPTPSTRSPSRPSASASSISSTSSGEPTATPAATPRIPTRSSRRSPPATAPTSAASPTSTPAATPASPRTATGPRPTPAISSTGISKCRRRCPGSPDRAQWIFKDFTTPLRVENPVPRINQKGVIERDMTKKESYYVFQSYWTDVPMVHIYGHTWPIRWGDAGEQKMVKVYSNCETAELFVNGKSSGVKHRDSQDFPAAGLRWMTPFASGQNTLRVVATKGGKTVTDEIELPLSDRDLGHACEIKLTEKSRQTVAGDETVTVEAKLYDAKGVLCLDARNRLRFSIAGIGTLIDNRGTSKGSRVVEMYNGRAEISLTRKDGGSVVAVSTAGIKPAFCTIA